MLTHIHPGINQGHEAIQIDEVPHQVRMGQHHDLFGFRDFAIPGQDDQIRKGLEEVALRSRAEEGRWNPLAHHVPDDDIQTLSRMPDEDVKVAIDPLGGDGKRRHSQSGYIPGRLIEQQALLDFEPDFAFAFTGLFELQIHRLQFRRSGGDALLQLGVERTDLILSTFALCDVASDARGAYDSARCVPDGRKGQGDVDRPPIFPDQNSFEMLGTFAAFQCLHDALPFIPSVSWYERRNGPL